MLPVMLFTTTTLRNAEFGKLSAEEPWSGSCNTP